MAYRHNKSDQTAWQCCIGCGHPIRLLNDHQSLVIFLGETIMQRRGYRCMNCTQATCFECSEILSQCACGSNAWVALPYLDETTGETAADR